MIKGKRRDLHVVATGTPEELMLIRESHTRRFLREHLSYSNGHHKP
ncbi:MAG TPA: hypothetical protein VIW80_01220 [Pyrinomonadaceae bacterium]|jgi:excinuclease UvrABC ATPase subunit